MNGDGGFFRLARVSGIFLLIGLVIEAISLHWTHPLAFLAFVMGGGGFLILGVLLFLYALVFKS